jgi:hypothetical protein
MEFLTFKILAIQEIKKNQNHKTKLWSQVKHVYVMMVTIMGHECILGAVWTGGSGRGEAKRKGL